MKLGLVTLIWMIGTSAVHAENSPLTNEGSWPDISPFVVEDSVVKTDVNKFSAEVPQRAQDAATVPVRFKAASPKFTMSDATIVIDENPSPIAAEFHFGPAMQPVDFETRVRVNLYSNVRVLAKFDGVWYMDGGFVKASGGCSAPATKSPDAAKIGLGEIKIKSFNDNNALPTSSPRKSMQLMIRHPNYSGLQRDQISLLTIPAFYIQTLSVFQGDDLLFSMDGGISISENPTFRFEYNDNGATELKVVAKDTDGNVYESAVQK